MPMPQVIAMRATAMDGAWGPWSTAATSAASRSFASAGFGSSPRVNSHTISAKLTATNQIFDGITAIADHAGFHFDDRGCPPCFGSFVIRPGANLRFSVFRVGSTHSGVATFRSLSIGSGRNPIPSICSRCRRPTWAAARQAPDRHWPDGIPAEPRHLAIDAGGVWKSLDQPSLGDLGLLQRLGNRQNFARGNSM